MFGFPSNDLKLAYYQYAIYNKFITIFKNNTNYLYYKYVVYSQKCLHHNSTRVQIMIINKFTYI